MANRTHFGIVIARSTEFTYMAALAASRDCRFRCTACQAKLWAIQRPHGHTAWLCSRCTDLKQSGQEPGPRPFNTQPPRQLAIGERLRGPNGMWTVTTSQRIDRFENGVREQGAEYVLTRDDGHEEKLRGRDMLDFHLIPPAEQTTIA
ncbi:hypothetical protein [Streptomyces caniscabiei]|uniref:Uncharacterized protein n=1 Tax=Streptomyces caniscabiei TaxID=2746961 RepID=A0ABU4MPQ8_9ACTN|nr:hypothetical protein [Streptomyces caniscabiei]MBE4735715.1 hypothetical protein [Streptomyces caniscabiei]MBE4758328.1 hypothetical protein [Streptomyces caniscabiei]MBE4788422.1 hypothetical protein [Streptomyces caniscabiei]MBE4796135.1 hypothetical protein [Streptomyces caniscabiei]MDX2944440.1 hypothetical protein [Streptomyces caniscabiei]